TIYQKLLMFLLLLPAAVFAQGTVSGTVLEEGTGLPLPGVSVQVTGSSQGTSTDFDGNFSLNNVTSGAVITFSYLGYTDVAITYTGQARIQVDMTEAASDLQEVVVQVGYGTVRKKDATGAVTTVSPKDFNRGTVVTAENLINGKVAGV